MIMYRFTRKEACVSLYTGAVEDAWQRTASDENEDWLKGLKKWPLAPTLDELLHRSVPEASTDEEKIVALKKLLALPVSRSMPEELREEIRSRFEI